MADPEAVVNLPRPLPADDHELGAASMTPNEMRLLKAQTGRPLDRAARRRRERLDWRPTGCRRWSGSRCAAPATTPSWDEAGDVVLDISEADAGPYERRALDGLANFCRFWRMTPRQVDELTPDEYEAFDRATPIRETAPTSGAPARKAALVANPTVVVDFVADTQELDRGRSTQVEQSGQAAVGAVGKIDWSKAGALAAGAAGDRRAESRRQDRHRRVRRGRKVAAQTNAVIKSTGGVAT